MSLIQHINVFCKFFIKKRDNYTNNISGHVIGSFKSNHKKSFDELIKNNIEFNANNFCTFFYNCLSTSNLEPDDLTSPIIIFIQDAIAKKPKYGNTSEFSEDHIAFFKNLIEKSNELYNDIQIYNPFIITDTQSQSGQNTPTDSETLDNMNLINNNSNTSFLTQNNMVDFFKKFEDTLISKLDATINNRISSEMIKHLGIDRNLSSQQVSDYKKKLGYTYNSILRKENQIQILKSHKENGTTPKTLWHQNFPAPFQSFNSNILYIEKYNEIIDNTQKAIMDLDILYFQEDIDLLKNDIKVFKDTLKHHVTDINKLDKEIYDHQNNSLKKTFESSTVKVINSKAQPYLVNSAIKEKMSSNIHIQKKPGKKPKINNGNNNIDASHRSIYNGPKTDHQKKAQHMRSKSANLNNINNYSHNGNQFNLNNTNRHKNNLSNNTSISNFNNFNNNTSQFPNNNFVNNNQLFRRNQNFNSKT